MIPKFVELVTTTTKQNKVYTDEEVVESAFEYYRKNGFPYKGTPYHVAMQEINKLREMTPAELLNSVLGHTIADTYHHQRFHVRCDGKLSVFDVYQDDARFIKSLRKMMGMQGYIPGGYFSAMGWTSNAQAAANFRPAWTAMVCRKYCKNNNATVLDTSTGFGGRLVGCIASGCVGYYIGVDPARRTCRGNMHLYRELGDGKLRIKLIQKPAEDVDGAPFESQCDFAVTSPPYWSKEHYSNEPTQSWIRYKTGDEWREGFLTNMLKLHYRSLKPGCTSVVVVADVTVGSKRWPIVDWVESVGADVGFTVQTREPYPINRVPGRNPSKQRFEVGCVLQKPK